MSEVPEEQQPETQGMTPGEAQDGPAGEGDLDEAAYTAEQEQEALAEGRSSTSQ